MPVFYHPPTTFHYECIKRTEPKHQHANSHSGYLFPHRVTFPCWFTALTTPNPIVPVANCSTEGWQSLNPMHYPPKATSLCRRGAHKSILPRPVWRAAICKWNLPWSQCLRVTTAQLAWLLCVSPDLLGVVLADQECLQLRRQLSERCCELGGTPTERAHVNQLGRRYRKWQCIIKSDRTILATSDDNHPSFPTDVKQCFPSHEKIRSNEHRTNGADALITREELSFGQWRTTTTKPTASTIDIQW